MQLSSPVLRALLLSACGSLAVTCSGNNWRDGGDGGGDGDSDVDSDIDADTDNDVDSDGDTGADADADHDVAAENDVHASPWDRDDADSSGVSFEDDELTLESTVDEDPGIWIANTGESTVSRLHADTGVEIGRYPSVLLDGTNHAQALTEPCVMETNGNCPSRTAIDFVGNCYVANRGFGHQGTLTKIARHERDCIDRNGNGRIDTSHDADGNGRIDTGSPAEFFPDDECVLWTIDVGRSDERPRALAIAPSGEDPSGPGNVWVGLNAAHSAIEVSPDGDVLRSLPLPIQPYGAVASKYLGLVWFTSAAWQDPSRSSWLDDARYRDNPPAICSVNFRTGEVSPRILVAPDAPCQGAYGIGADSEGRVWVGAEQCPAAFRYDPTDESWLYVDLSWSGVRHGLTRGIVGDRDGRIWVAHSHCNNGLDGGPDCGLVTSFDAETGGDQVHYRIDGAVGSIGVDLDYLGRLWAVNFDTNSASRIDALSGEVETYPVGTHPYTYSDFTGYSLLTQFPRGYYRNVFEVCPNADWVGAQVDASVPAGTEVHLRVRVADDRASLATAEWYGPWTSFPANLDAPPGPVPDGAVLEFEITLIADGALVTPTVRDLVLTYDCPVG
jgi:hypothetical protein